MTVETAPETPAAAVVEETSKAVESDVKKSTLVRVERPNRAEFDKELKVLNEQIQQGKDTLERVKSELDKIHETRKKDEEKFSGHNAKLKELQKARQAVNDKRDALFTEMKKQKALRQRMKDAHDNMKAKLTEVQCFSLEIVDKKIRDMEYYLSTNRLTLKEEKDVIQDIGKLKGSRKIIGEFDAIATKLREAEAAGKAISTQLDENKAELEEARKHEKAQADKIKKLRGGDKKNNPAAELIALRNTTRKEQNALFAKVKKLRDEQRKKEDAFRKYIAEKKKEDAERYKAEQEARKEEEKLRKLQEEEEKEDSKYSNDFATIDQLTALLKKQQGPSEEKAEDKVDDKPSDLEGMTLIGKAANAIDDDVFGTKKAGKKKAKKSKKKSSNLVHDLKTIQEFESLKISAPLSVDEIPASLKALEEKKAALNKDKEDKRAKRLAKLAALEKEIEKKNAEKETEKADGAEKKDEDKKDESAETAKTEETA